MLPEVRSPFIHHISVQDVYTSILVDCLCLLVHQSLAFRNVKGNDSTGIVSYCALRVVGKFREIPQVGNHLTPTVLPDISIGVTIGITNVMVVLGPVRPRLLLVLGIARVVPSRIFHKAPVYPSDVEGAVTVGHPVDVRVALHACQVGADVRIAAIDGTVGIEMVVSQSSLAVTVGEEHLLAKEAKSGVSHVVERFVRGWDSREAVKSSREDIWMPADGMGPSGYVLP